MRVVECCDITCCVSDVFCKECESRGEDLMKCVSCKVRFFRCLLDQKVKDVRSPKTTYIEAFDCEAPKECRFCGGKDLMLGYRGSANMIQVSCADCGSTYSLKHIRADNRRRETNDAAHWKAKVRARDGNKCVICGATEDLHVHHIIPVSNDTEKKYIYNVGNGVTLCSKCHAMVHPFMNREGRS